MAARSLSLLLTLIILALCGVASAQNGIVEEIVIHGNRRIPAETIKARIFTRAGDIYDQTASSEISIHFGTLAISTISGSSGKRPQRDGAFISM